MRLPVFKALGASFAYLFSHAAGILKTLWLPTLAIIGVNFAVMPSYLEQALAMSSVDPSADPQAAFKALAPMMKSIGVVYLVYAVFWPMTISGIQRHLIRGESPRLPFYLQFGMDEVRILVSYILLIIMIGLVYIVGVLGVVVLGAVAALTGGAIGGAIVGLATLALFVAFIWFLLRLSLTFPATIDARKIGVAESWRVTRGNVWGLFFYYFVWLLIFVALAFGFIVIAVPTLMPAIMEIVASAQDPSAAAEIEKRIVQMQLDMFDPSKPGFFVFAAASYGYTIVSAAILNVASGVAYRYLAGDTKS